MTATKYKAFFGAVTRIRRILVGLRSRSFVFQVCLFGTMQTCLNISSELIPESQSTACVNTRLRKHEQHACVCAGEDPGLLGK